MSRIDPYYTPSSLALRMVGLAKLAKPTCIADFAVGDGQLLRAAQSVWPDAAIIATDISEEELCQLNESQPSWRTGYVDFLDEKSRKHCSVLSDLKQKVQLVLLNPPFTCTGNSYQQAEINSIHVRCGTALAFVINSLPFLSEGGELIAVLPEGTVYSQRDEEAWSIIRQYYSIEILDVNGRYIFSGCSPNTVLIRISSLNSERRSLLPENIGSGSLIDEKCAGLIVKIFRGKVQVSDVKSVPLGNNLPFIHSTSLKSGEIVAETDRVSAEYYHFHGPAVLIQRVGQPKKEKITIYESNQHIVISDCIIAIICRTTTDAHDLHLSLRNSWPSLQKEYRGTGAKYLTVRSLTRVLQSLGCLVSFEAETAQLRQSLSSITILEK